MVRIVLSEPDRDGVFTPQLAVTTSDETEALTFSLYGVSHTVTAYANRLGSVGKLSNRIDISQAMGGVPQAVTFDFDLIDWDGFGRVSISLFEAAARFVGWEVSLIVDNADPINLAVKNCSTNGDTISFQCCSRYEITSRPCAFGAGGQQVGLVVGGHDVSVETAGLPEPAVILRKVSGASFTGRPGAPVVFLDDADAATKKIPTVVGDPDRLIFFACADKPTADAFVLRLIDICRNAGATISGEDLSLPLSIAGGIGSFWAFATSIVPAGGSAITTWGIVVNVTSAFYDSEDVDKVKLFEGASGGAICAGGGRLIGFEEDGRISLPEGTTTIADGVLSFQPTNLAPNGFVSYSILPSTIVWQAGYSTPSSLRKYYGDSADIRTDGTDPGGFDTYSASNLDSISPTRFTVWATLQNTGAPVARLPFRAYVEPIDWTPDRVIVDMKAQIVTKSDPTIGSFPVLYDIPFTQAGPVESGEDDANRVFVKTWALQGQGFKTSDFTFDDIADLNSHGEYTANFPYAVAGNFYVNFQLLAVTVYGQTNLSFGSNSAVVTPGAGPLDAPEGTFPARATGGVTLPEAAACILSANGWFPQSPGNYPVGTVPTWTPSASAVGEYLEPSLSFIGAAEKLARESWAIFALEQNALGTSDELPEPPTITLGQDTDIVTEPTIEYQSFGGKYLGKAYISNVDQVFDATNPSAFYGGWGLAPAGAEEAEGTDYGYLIWQRCRAAFLAHGIKRGESYQFDGIHDAATMGRMWWEAKRNGFRRIDWLAFHPRYMTFSVKRFAGWGWAGSSTRLPQTMAGGAGYDVAAWGPLYNDAVTVAAVDADPMTGATTFSVALPPVVTDGHDISLTVDTLNNALDLSTDTLDSGLPLTTDTLEG